MLCLGLNVCYWYILFFPQQLICCTAVAFSCRKLKINDKLRKAVVFINLILSSFLTHIYMRYIYMKNL